MSSSANPLKDQLSKLVAEVDALNDTIQKLPYYIEKINKKLEEKRMDEEVGGIPLNNLAASAKSEELLLPPKQMERLEEKEDAKAPNEWSQIRVIVAAYYKDLLQAYYKNLLQQRPDDDSSLAEKMKTMKDFYNLAVIWNKPIDFLNAWDKTEKIHLFYARDNTLLGIFGNAFRRPKGAVFVTSISNVLTPTVREQLRGVSGPAP